MSAIAVAPQSADISSSDTAVFARIASGLRENGYAIVENALPESLQTVLRLSQAQLSQADYHMGGIGRQSGFQRIEDIRNDGVCWIDGATGGGKAWLNWTESLRQHLNRQLFMGLFSFESHFAHYPPGHFYKTHYDAFRGQGNRVVSLVTYLNESWSEADGGELVVYRDDNDTAGIPVLPKPGTLVAFLSEEFPHEVLPARRDRYSVAGWFRMNTSSADVVDPPR
ncbi:2OG-Fe(II) oxygenase [Alteromonas sp. ASW11-19]|uniref:2OG-Fe(II) oxygenase n=1 Tax=Alteromonas salexigens TaxID=2982530 RepID=A0ABT2VRW1_9ALTE|nr:2OG-Fe(II) oxygenase [Alteromonas salexigens]MCU7555789.1 2OG-Fe(II) oxygenase [Alteromonas salexigens]